MPDATTTDDELAAQLRAWADDLADQIPAATAPTTSAGRHGRRPRLLALAAAVVALVAAVAIGAIRPGEGDEDVRAGTTTASTTTAVTGPRVALEGTVWWLEAMEIDGEVQDLPPDFEPTVSIGPSPCGPRAACIDGTSLSVYDGCNHRGAAVVVGRTRFTARDGASTVMGCVDPVGALANRVGDISMGTTAYAIEGDVLTLRHDLMILTLRAGDGPYPPRPEGGAVLADVGGTDAHRVTWVADDGVVRLEARRSADSRPGAPLADPAEVDLAPEAADGRIEAVILRGTRPVVVGLVDARATEVTYEYQGFPVVIPTVALPGVPEVRAFTAEVPARTGWIVRATAPGERLVASLQGPP